MNVNDSSTSSTAVVAVKPKQKAKKARVIHFLFFLCCFVHLFTCFLFCLGNCSILKGLVAPVDTALLVLRPNGGVDTSLLSPTLLSNRDRDFLTDPAVTCLSASQAPKLNLGLYLCS